MKRIVWLLLLAWFVLPAGNITTVSADETINRMLAEAQKALVQEKQPAIQTAT